MPDKSKRELKREVKKLKENRPTVGTECIAPAFVDTRGDDVTAPTRTEPETAEIDSVFIANDPKE
jgi:hypothetical protein